MTPICEVVHAGKNAWRKQCPCGAVVRIRGRGPARCPECGRIVYKYGCASWGWLNMNLLGLAR